MAAALLLSSAAPARAFEPGLDFDQGVAVPAVLRAAREHAAPSLDVERVRGPLAAHPRAVWILKSSGVCDGCAEAISKMLFTVGIPSQILGPGQLKSAVKPNDLIVIGGGIPDSDGEWTIKQDLMKAGAFEWVKQHIANGGRYVGICAGAYLTEKWIDQDNGEHGLDIFPGKIDNYTEGKKTKYLLTHWKNGVSRRVYFQDGPAMVPRRTTRPRPPFSPTAKAWSDSSPRTWKPTRIGRRKRTSRTPTVSTTTWASPSSAR